MCILLAQLYRYLFSPWIKLTVSGAFTFWPLVVECNGDIAKNDDSSCLSCWVAEESFEEDCA
jgi:hypothetical protein